MTEPMLTKNIEKLRKEVAAHVAADSIIQGTYWDSVSSRGCFIGCLAHSDRPAVNETNYGLPVMVQRIAESIFERLAADEAKEFFAALPDAVACNGKDLSKVGWQFLAAELRALPAQSSEVQAAIDPVIAGMDLLAEGKQWLSAADADAAVAGACARAAVYVADAAAANAADAAAANAADAAAAAARAANAAADAAAARAANAAWAAAAANAADAADAAANAAAGCLPVLRRQRDLLLHLISEAPILKGKSND